MTRPLLLLLVALLLATRPLAADGVLDGRAGGEEPRVPFGPGERISFSVGWGFINAGSSWLEVKDTVTVDGHLCWEIESRARSNDVLGTLYPVDDRVTTWMDTDELHSRGLEKRLREGGYKKDRRYAIQPEKGRILKFKHDEPLDTLKFARHVQDVLSAFYWVRTRPLRVGQVLEVEAVDELKTYRLAVKVLERETIRLKAGEYDCFKIQPILLGEGLFKAKGEVFIWLTADERRIPVRMKSKIFIGAISASMVEYRPPNLIPDAGGPTGQGRD